MTQTKQTKTKREFAQLQCDFMFKRLFLLSEINNFTPEELAQYLESLESMSDYYNIIDSAAELAEKRGREAGMAEGLARGREEGREEGRNQTIRQLLESGMSIDMIAEALNLTNEERLLFQ